MFFFFIMSQNVCECIFGFKLYVVIFLAYFVPIYILHMPSTCINQHLVSKYNTLQLKVFFFFLLNIFLIA